MLPVLPALLLTALTLSAPAFVASGDLGYHVGDAALHVAAEASDQGVKARADSPAGWQVADVRSECVPDTDAHCDTDVNCEPTSANCWATRRPRAPFPCHTKPDGSMVCDFNGTQPNNTGPLVLPALPDGGQGNLTGSPLPPIPAPPEPACDVVFSQQLCLILLGPADDVGDVCARVASPMVCAVLPAPPQPPEPPQPPARGDACREVFAEGVCARLDRP